MLKTHKYLANRKNKESMNEQPLKPWVIMLLIYKQHHEPS
jgi:hypothetical protein